LIDIAGLPQVSKRPNGFGTQKLAALGILQIGVF
jgi:hypothetical protein